MTDFTRLIETEGFPLEEASRVSPKESAGSAGTIRELHRYPARRPLAACRATILSSIIPDPGNREERMKMKKLLSKLITNSKIAAPTEEILRCRQLIESTNYDRGGEQWRVLDPFAGGGSIPFEALRLGCQVEASDLNPVAWLVQMATMGYPSKIGMDEFPLPQIIRDDLVCFSAAGGRQQGSTLDSWGDGEEKSRYNLAEHLNAWGSFFLSRCEEILKPYYQSTEGTTPLAYIWFRTFDCPECRGRVPIFNNSILQKNSKGIVSAVEPKIDKARKKIDWNVRCKNSGDDLTSHKKISFKTSNKVTCPFCDTISVTSKEVRRHGLESGLGHELVAVVEQSDGVRRFRSPLLEDLEIVERTRELTKEFEEKSLGKVFCEDVPKSGQGASRAFTVGQYGMTQWKDLFNPRQYWAVHVQMDQIREITQLLREHRYPQDWIEAITVYLSCALSGTAGKNNVQSMWDLGGKSNHMYADWKLPILWNYSEVYPLSDAFGSLQANLKTVVNLVSDLCSNLAFTEEVSIVRRSALDPIDNEFDLIITDPPYYDSVPYSDTLDFFYMMFKAITRGLSDQFDEVFSSPLTPKWDEQSTEKELIQDANRHDGNSTDAKTAYEDGMAQAFIQMHSTLKENGRLVVVFAHKDPEAWETLVSALIRAGFTTTAAWPIKTERTNRPVSSYRAFLSSSVWLVLKKRDSDASYEFDREVFDSIQSNIEEKMKRFWDSNIRGPDFIWAATGAGLEIYSQYEVVRKFDEPDELVSVGEFLDRVRNIVLRFSIGRLLTDFGTVEDEAEMMDDLTRYYLLHRTWFKHLDIEAGEVRKFASACGFTDTQLSGKLNLLKAVRGSKRRLSVSSEGADNDARADADNRGGSKYSLLKWNHRELPKNENAFNQSENPPSMIDHVHRLLHLRMEDERSAVDDHIKHWALGGHPILPALVQALQEMVKEEDSNGTEELSLLESLSKDLERLAGVKPAQQVTLMDYMNEEDD